MRIGCDWFVSVVIMKVGDVYGGVIILRGDEKYDKDILFGFVVKDEKLGEF